MKKIVYILILFTLSSCTIIETSSPKETSTLGKIFNFTTINLVNSTFLRNEIFETNTDIMESDKAYKPPKPYEDEKIIYNKDMYISILTNSRNKNKPTNKRKLAYIIAGGAFYHVMRNSNKDLYTWILNHDKENDFDIILVKYSSAEIKQYPAQLNEIMSAWKYILNLGYLPENIVIMGDSAGGNLTLAHTLKLRDNNLPMPKALVLLSPWTDLTNSVPSRSYNKYRDVVMGTNPLNDVESHPDAFTKNVYGQNDDLKNPYISPIFGDYHDFPTTIIEVGSFEMLFDDSYYVYKNMKQNNVDVYFKDYPGMFHVFHYLPLLPEAKSSSNRITEILKGVFNEKK